MGLLNYFYKAKHIVLESLVQLVLKMEFESTILKNMILNHEYGYIRRYQSVTSIRILKIGHEKRSGSSKNISSSYTQTREDIG